MGSPFYLPRLDSLAGKLNLTIVGLFIAVFGSGSLWLSHSLSARLEESGIENLTATNQRVIQMVDAYASALEQSATMLGNSFALQFGEAAQAGAMNDAARNRLVESFTRSTKGVATLFVREGDDFVRTATTLQNAEGQRATGTRLDRQHPGFAAVSSGQSYTGRASLFGREYMTHYAPLKDASGQVTGIAFIGVDFTESLAALKKQIRDIRIGDTGYVYILDAGAQPGTVVVHPTAEGKNLLDSKAGDGRPFIRDMLNEKAGLMRYSSADSAYQDKALRDKIAAFASFPRWNWLVASSSFRDEFTRDARFVSIALGVSCLVITLLLAGSVTVLIQRWLAQPLQEAVEVFRRMAGGDLRVALKARSQDEIGQMMQACGQMCDALRGMVQKIQHSMHNISRESEQLMQTADNVAIGSQEQSDGAAALASSIEELSVGIEQVAGHSGETRKIVEDAARISGHGSSVIAEAVTAMGGIAETVRSSSQVVAELEYRTAEIAKIASVIREIADQTNLLALNAAIEAARAGEQGRGFAVVADEVRKLAERTTLSTQEIARTLEQITTGARNATESMNRGVEQVSTGVELASKAGACIAEMHAGSTHVGHSVTGIADSMREQSAASEHIASTVEEIAHQAENNREQAQLSANASRQMYEIAQETRRSLEWFRL